MTWVFGMRARLEHAFEPIEHDAMTCHGREFVRTTRSAWPVRTRSRARSCIEGAALLRTMPWTYAADALRRGRGPRRSAPGVLYTHEFACMSA